MESEDYIYLCIRLLSELERKYLLLDSSMDENQVDKIVQVIMNKGSNYFLD